MKEILSKASIVDVRTVGELVRAITLELLIFH